MAALDMLSELLRLPANERARLALELIRSLDEAPEADAAAAWDAEIERRGAEVDAGTADTMPYQIKEAVRQFVQVEIVKGGDDVAADVVGDARREDP